MPPKCVLFYNTDRTDEWTEKSIDREAASGGLSLVGVSAPASVAVPGERRNLPFVAPEALSGMDFDYVIVTENSLEDKLSQTRSRIKRLLPPFLMRLYFRLSARVSVKRRSDSGKTMTAGGRALNAGRI